MGYFKVNDVPSPQIHELTIERVAELLDRRELIYGRSESDPAELGGYWNRWLIRFRVFDGLFVIAGKWDGQVDRSDMQDVVDWSVQQNRDTYFPKIFPVFFEDDGWGLVFTEFSVVCEAGVTDEQLDTYLRVGIQTAVEVLERLDERYPELAAAATAAFEQ